SGRSPVAQLAFCFFRRFRFVVCRADCDSPWRESYERGDFRATEYMPKTTIKWGRPKGSTATRFVWIVYVPDETTALRTAGLLRRVADCFARIYRRTTLSFRAARTFARLFFLTGELIGSQEFFKSSASARSQFSSASPPVVAQISYARSRML